MRRINSRARELDPRSRMEYITRRNGDGAKNRIEGRGISLLFQMHGAQRSPWHWKKSAIVYARIIDLKKRETLRYFTAAFTAMHSVRWCYAWQTRSFAYERREENGGEWKEGGRIGGRIAWSRAKSLPKRVKYWRQNFHTFFFFFEWKDAKMTVNWRYEAHLVNLFPGGRAKRCSGNYTIGGSAR